MIFFRGILQTATLNSPHLLISSLGTVLPTCTPGTRAAGRQTERGGFERVNVKALWGTLELGHFQTFEQQCWQVWILWGPWEVNHPKHQKIQSQLHFIYIVPKQYNWGSISTEHKGDHVKVINNIGLKVDDINSINIEWQLDMLMLYSQKAKTTSTTITTGNSTKPWYNSFRHVRCLSRISHQFTFSHVTTKWGLHMCVWTIFSPFLVIYLSLCQVACDWQHRGLICKQWLLGKHINSTKGNPVKSSDVHKLLYHRR